MRRHSNGIFKVRRINRRFRVVEFGADFRRNQLRHYKGCVRFGVVAEMGRSVLRPYKGWNELVLEAVRFAEGADYCGGVALVRVDLGVEVAHVGGGEFSG